MLVLSRQVGQALVIGDDIRVTVLAVQGDRVRLGILAPPEVVVVRQGVYERRPNTFGEGPVLSSSEHLHGEPARGVLPPVAVVSPYGRV